MVDLSRIVSMLELKRQELIEQLDAVDKAIAALRSTPAGDIVAEIVEDQQAAEVSANTSPPLVPTRVKPKRVLGEAHKQALTIGRRKAREAREAAAGLAREMPDDSFVPAIAAPRANQPPRLVKKPRDRP
jgi:hypothetical protein